jgi:hypothetical protein
VSATAALKQQVQQEKDLKSSINLHYLIRKEIEHTRDKEVDLLWRWRRAHPRS